MSQSIIRRWRWMKCAVAEPVFGGLKIILPDSCFENQGNQDCYVLAGTFVLTIHTNYEKNQDHRLNVFWPSWQKIFADISTQIQHTWQSYKTVDAE